MRQNSDTSDSILQGLIDYINESKDNEMLEKVASGLEKEVERKKDENEIIVTSKIKLNEEQLNKIKNIMNRIMKIDFPVKNRIDESIIGGFTIKVNDWFFDSSLSKEIRNYKRLLLET